jgi:hypothetical protein
MEHQVVWAVKPFAFPTIGDIDELRVGLVAGNQRRLEPRNSTVAMLAEKEPLLGVDGQTV